MMSQNRRKIPQHLPEFRKDDLLATVNDAWGNFSTNDLTFANTTSVQKSTAPTLQTCISVTGDWHGIIQLSCEVDLAIDMAAEIFGHQDDTTALNNAADLLGEITNMTAGTIVAQIAGTSELSLPGTTDLIEQTTNNSMGTISQELTMVCKSRPVHLVILDRRRKK